VPDDEGADTGAPRAAQGDVRSYIGVPLTSRGQIIGALTLTRSDGRRPFDDDEFRFAQDLAARTALSVDNERLYEREHQVALELQRSLLAGDLPRDERLDLAVSYRPVPGDLEFAGGDWHDAIARADGRIALIVGDVVGHGLPAATAMGQLRSASRALAFRCGDPSELLDGLDVFAEQTPGAEYATVVCVLLDPGSGDLRYACAGHVPPLIAPARAIPRYLDGARSVPLAAVANPRRRSARASLPRDATLLLYTDGLVERRGEHIDASFARLVAAIEDLRASGVEALTGQLASRMLAGRRQHDDIALLAARRRARTTSRFPASPPHGVPAAVGDPAPIAGR
jgi:serine/threonine-protein kinase RsbW